MTTLAGLPAHALLVHGVVVLAPLTAILAILCAVWPAARQRFVWLVVALAAINLALTPLTTSAGQWLYNQESEHRPILEKHEELGETMIYYSIGLLVVALAIAVLHVLAHRTDKTRTVATVVVAVAAVLIGASAIVGVVGIGHSGAEAKWGTE
jgi:membrane-associated PAP2 superfamily phosphatase